jgi:hypothetical protein
VETIHSGALLYSFGELFEDCPDNWIPDPPRHFHLKAKLSPNFAIP